MLFDGALLPVVVQTTVRSPEGDVYVQTNWYLFLVIVGLQVAFLFPNWAMRLKKPLGSVL